MLTRRQKLDVGDYSVAGFANVVTIEYKSLSDWSTWIGTSSTRTKRFYSQVEKLAKLKHAVVVVGAPMGAISYMAPATAADSVSATIELAAMGVRVVHCPDHHIAGTVTRRLLDLMVEMATKERLTVT